MKKTEVSPMRREAFAQIERVAAPGVARSRPSGSARAKCSMRAFTLIELLVVVAIIGLLISLLSPSLSRAVASARRVGCVNNMRGIGIGLMLYAGDHEGMLPGYGSPGYYWYAQLGTHNEYLPNPHMHDDNWPSRLGTIWKCSVPPDDTGSPRSDYGLNRNVAPRITGPGLMWGDTTSNPWTHNGPYSVQAVSESATAMLSDLRTIFFRRTIGIDGGMIHPDRMDRIFRHSDGANIMFLDQHVEHRSGDEIIESIANIGQSAHDAFWGEWWR